jgi:inner membrane protein
MRFYTHVACSILFYVTFAYLINLDIVIFGIFVAGMISVFPDLIDRVDFKHRGIGHSLIWLIPFVIIGLLNFGIGFALIIGFLSHIFLDTLTWNGCPFIYPFSKINFVALNKRNRIKTGTAKEKAIFVFLLFMVVPTILFSTGFVSVSNFSGNQNTVFATGEASGVPLNNLNKNDITNEHINLNFQINSNTNKNITIHKNSENETNVIIKDLEAGG